ncbi:MAG: TonB family protein [Rhodobacteraceae bacterium]|nr:MAG: TonB family protein [Paracoccaceae bacterium]
MIGPRPENCSERKSTLLRNATGLKRLDTPGLPALALAAGLSILFHLGAMAALAPRDTAQTAGSGDEAPAALGTSFADFAEGRLTPETPQALLPQNPATATRAPAPETETPSAAESVASAKAIAIPADQPEPATSSTAPEQKPARPSLIAPNASGALLPVAPAQASESAAPALQPLTTGDSRLAAAPPTREALQATRPEALAPDTSPTARAPETSRKPRARPDRTARARQPQGTARQTTERGNPQATTQGRSAGTAPARSQTSAPGSAAASNYPGEVLRRIHRVPTPRSPGRGSVLVSFSVSNNGGLNAVSVARSSGNASLDRAAVNHIRRAAPFPPPPAGAKRNFSFEFVGG